VYLSRLTLSNFRNLVQVELELPRGVVVFFGANAQGKTALLEAIYTLAIARSFRAENEREVVNFQAATQLGQALVGGTIEKRGERLFIYVGYQCVPATVAPRGGGVRSSTQDERTVDYSVRKQIRVSRVRRTAAELVGTVNAVLFSAGDIDLVQGPPSGRRRYLDILISQADPLYLKSLQRYQRVVQQRNHLLRLRREGRARAVELAFWDDELVREGSAITWCRQEAMKALSRWCWEQHRELAGEGEDLLVSYHPNISPGESPLDTESQFRESLAALQHREQAAAVTMVGPHRDDFKLLVNGVDMAVFASRGQARTLALSLRLAEAAYLALVRGEAPIVLLDDILSEMDASRRRRVLEKAAQYQQVLVTTTDLGLVRGFFGPKAAYFQVSSGSVLPLMDGGSGAFNG
jgi:DNA replication and repair protein RecF